MMLLALTAGAGTVLPLVALSALCHELGHLSALYLARARVEEIRLTAFGAEIRADTRYLPYGREILCTLAGPAVNLLCGLGLSALGAWTAAGAHLSLCAFNLLPVRPLDGGRALQLLAAWLAGPSAGEAAARWAGAAAALALGLGAVWLMARTGGSLWLLPSAAGLLAAAAGEITGYRREGG